jgi:hypothetical protein
MASASEHRRGTEQDETDHQSARDFLHPIQRMVREIAKDAPEKDDADVDRQYESGKIFGRPKEAKEDLRS